MAASNHDADPKLLPVPFSARPEADIEHHRREWTSGTRAKPQLPKDFGWNSNPKQMQEENGSGELEKPISK